LLLLLLAAGQALAGPHAPPPSGAQAEMRLQARFAAAGLDYPPERVQLIALKQGRRLEVWVWQGGWRHLHDYPVFAASGQPGPKLREGDRQVPEGFYRIAALNPNSHFHLSMKLDYPNPFDRLHATLEGRERPGSNIFIHGSAWSTGCLAMGNRGIEELYTLVARVGLRRVEVLIAPWDFRRRPVRLPAGAPAWLGELYGYLQR